MTIRATAALSVLLAAACSNPASITATGSADRPIAAGAEGFVRVAWCTRYAPNGYNANAGFDAQGNPYSCSEKAKVTALDVTTDDASLIQLGRGRTDQTDGSFTFRALAPGTATLHVAATFEPGGQVTEDVEVTIAAVATAGRTCTVAGSSRFRCDGTDPALLTGVHFDVEYGPLRDGFGTALDGHIEVEMTWPNGGSSISLDRKSTSTVAPGLTVVRPTAAQLQAVFPPVSFNVVGREQVTGAVLTLLDLSSPGFVGAAMPAEVTELKLTEQEETSGGKAVPLVPIVRTTGGGWALASSADVFSRDDDVLQVFHATGASLFRLRATGDATLVLPLVLDEHEMQVTVRR